MAEQSEKCSMDNRYCYQDFSEIDPKAAKKHLRPVILDPLQATRGALQTLSKWRKEGITKVVEETAASFEITMGKLGQPIRVAVTGGPVSPPIDVTLYLVGQERTLARLDRAIGMIEERAAASQ